MNVVHSHGKWLRVDRVTSVFNPYTGKPAGQMARADAAQVIEAARAAKEFHGPLSAHERGEILLRTAGRIRDISREFVQSIVGETGNAHKDAVTEVRRAIAQLRFGAEEAKRLTGESISTDVTDYTPHRLAVTLPEPLGLICAITPFNRPLNQVVTKVVPAVAAGNSVIVKPSEKAPLTATLFVRALLDSGLPAGSIALVTGDPAEIGDALVTCEHIDMVTFTGSAAVGKHIARRIGMIRSAFELGDSGALIVADDADLDAAVTAAVAGAYSTAGQSCRGVKRVLVHTDVADEFAAMLVKQTEQLVVGDPADPATDVGTLIDEEAAVRVEGRVAEAVAGGARLLAGGRRRGAQYWPTVLDHVDRAAPLVCEETFGPCAPLVRIKDVDDAVDHLNSGRLGLQTGVFTRRLDDALRVARTLRTGAVVVNGGPQFESPNIPFGGVRDSGHGREGVRYAMREMTRVKTLVL
ncbi:aldehyde dehydrogenase family protein [Streptomyces acidiscabies]|uniref:aldehyde dehydrogenase family protein n=1 Tax=Streptomyces acidiscabies TaxID=42234 RepID=UPI0009667A4C|nr:aldehyde dehydrogenase family protein [Streptomyces acidiscabies]GAV39916.1 sulfoacetaldehyde dehydrogenase [Streptomyces acidiscabies]